MCVCQVWSRLLSLLSCNNAFITRQLCQRDQPRSWSEVHSRPLLESLGLMVPRLDPELLVGFEVQSPDLVRRSETDHCQNELWLIIANLVWAIQKYLISTDGFDSYGSERQQQQQLSCTWKLCQVIFQRPDLGKLTIESTIQNLLCSRDQTLGGFFKKTYQLYIGLRKVNEKLPCVPTISASVERIFFTEPNGGILWMTRWTRHGHTVLSELVFLWNATGTWK